MKRRIIQNLRTFLARLINKSSSLISAYFPWFFSLLAKSTWLRKIYFQYKHFFPSQKRFSKSPWLKTLISRLVNKSSLLIRKRMPRFFSFLSKHRALRKIYLRNKQFSPAKKSISQAPNTHHMFPNNNKEISLALGQTMALWPTRKRLHG